MNLTQLQQLHNTQVKSLQQDIQTLQNDPVILTREGTATIQPNVTTTTEPSVEAESKKNNMLLIGAGLLAAYFLFFKK